MVYPSMKGVLCVVLLAICLGLGEASWTHVFKGRGKKCVCDGVRKEALCDGKPKTLKCTKPLVCYYRRCMTELKRNEKNCKKTNRTCAPGLECDRITTGKCWRLSTSGEACDSVSNKCVQSTVCVSGKCLQVAVLYEACGGSTKRACDSRNHMECKSIQGSYKCVWKSSRPRNSGAVLCKYSIECYSNEKCTNGRCERK